MNCPYCEAEMKEGYLAGLSIVQGMRHYHNEEDSEGAGKDTCNLQRRRRGS